MDSEYEKSVIGTEIVEMGDLELTFYVTDANKDLVGGIVDTLSMSSDGIASDGEESEKGKGI